MKRILSFLIVVLCCSAAIAQTYNNEWIDYSKTHYKFYVGTNGLYRIQQPVLAAAGLGATQAQHFRLYRNGLEIPIYTSLASGVMGASDFIEFYGEQNDGKADKVLYTNDLLQMNDRLSLFTDTAAYFLTTNTVSANKRLVNTANNVAGNVLPAETWFSHTRGKYYNVMQNAGYGINYGEIVHSSSFETAEGWTSQGVFAGSPWTDNNPEPLYVFTSGPAASVTGALAGNDANGRTASVAINGAQVASSFVGGYNIFRFNNASVPLTTFTGDVANFTFTDAGPAADNIVVSYYELTYPRLYNFGGQSQFAFDLPASSSKYLAIKNFNFGAAAPVLYDVANGQRFIGVTNLDTVKFVIPTSAVARKLVLLNTEAANIKSITSLSATNFVNYSNVANQGDYIIISHPALFDNGSGVNNVELYRQYRNSVIGGAYNSKTVDINQLADQFAFGIKNHPSSIRNFSSFSLANFAVQPKYFFLIGRGLSYVHYTNHKSDPNTSKLAMVPTFGWPSSDNLLTASRTTYTPRIPIGRLSAISGTEVGDYLNKVQQFDIARTSTTQTFAAKSWMKNVAQITGAIDDESLYGLITAFMQGYESVISDTLYGGRVYNFSKNSGQYTALGTNKSMDDLFAEGLSMLTFFGHSSPNTLEFNLDNPQNYNNTGKYPLIIVNGCNTGDLFLFDTLRPVSKGTLSEKYVFAPNKGSIGFIASTHFGLPQQLNYFTLEFNRQVAVTQYGKGIGDAMKGTMDYMMANFSFDFTARTHAEEITYHGDPAVKLYPHAKPDYTTTDSLITINPTPASVADDKITIVTKIENIGRAIRDSLTVTFKLTLPDNSEVSLGTRRIRATLSEDTLVTSFNINPLIHKGLNRFTVTIDPSGLIDELSETNNTITKNFTIIDDEIRPVYPYNYSIVSSPANFALWGSTANPTQTSRQYVMELDTTQLFNSPFKKTVTNTSTGGAIKFVPAFTMVDSTVYYWRVAVGPVNGTTIWRNSSFTYLNGSTQGFNQSHYFQFKEDALTNMTIDAATRRFTFSDKSRKLLLRTGLYPFYDWDQININVDNDQLDFYGCRYRSLQFVVYDPLTLQPWENYNTAGSGRFGSWPVCDFPSRKFFEFPYYDQAYRKKAMDFFDSIPAGMYVSITNLGWTVNTDFINQWKADTAVYGSGNSLWHKFQQFGLNKIDSFTSNKPFVFVFKKGGNLTFPQRQRVGIINEHMVDTFNINGKVIDGVVETPWMGPAKQWFNFKWKDKPEAGSTNSKYFQIIGRDIFGNENTLATVYNSQDTGISFISAATYPYLKLRMITNDIQKAIPTQLKFWTLNGSQYPEGAVAPNVLFQYQDSLTTNDTLKFKVAFLNISNGAFDSVKVKLRIVNRFGVSTDFGLDKRRRPLLVNDSIIVNFDIPAAAFAGNNQVFLDVNPDNDQPEQYHFNNVVYRNLFVASTICPGTNITYTSNNTAAGNTYQWQVNSGTGFTNIANGGIYSGANTSSLTLTNPPTNMYGYKFRCQITNNSVISYSNDNVLKFSAEWNGSISTAWETVGNWSCTSIPDQFTDVIIKGGLPRYPNVNSNAVCRSINAKPGSSVTVTASFRLDVRGTY